MLRVVFLDISLGELDRRAKLTEIRLGYSLRRRRRCKPLEPCSDVVYVDKVLSCNANNDRASVGNKAYYPLLGERVERRAYRSSADSKPSRKTDLCECRTARKLS